MDSAFAQALAQYQQNAQGLGVTLTPFIGQQGQQPVASIAAPQGSSNELIGSFGSPPGGDVAQQNPLAGMSPDVASFIAQYLGTPGDQGSGVPMPSDQGQQPQVGQGNMQAPSIPYMPYTYPGQSDVIANRPAFPGLTGGVDYGQYKLA